MKWRTVTLGAMEEEFGGVIQTGPFGSQLHASEYSDVGTPVVMPTNIRDLRVATEGIARVDSTHVERLSRHKLRPGDIVYSRRGDVEKCALIGEDQAGWLCGTGCLLVRIDGPKVDTSCLAYVLSLPETRSWISQHAVGATMPNLNTSVLREVPVRLPPIDEQRAISSVLGAFDDKIELNRRTAETLEQMARALFKSWFIDFDLVKAKAEGRQPEWMDDETTALFPATLSGPHPEGWSSVPIGLFAEDVRDKKQPGDLDPSYPYVGLEHVTQRCVALWNWGNAGEVTSNKTAFEKGDVLFGKLRPYFHKVVYAPVAGVCSTDIIAVRPKCEEYASFVLMALSEKELIDWVTRSSSGTRMPRTKWADIANYKFPMPDNTTILRAYARFATQMIERIGQSIFENHRLVQTRDALLPKLLFGEIRIKDAEKITEEVL